MTIVCGFPDHRTCPHDFSTIDELEAHVTLVHFSLCVYECEHKTCRFARFPTIWALCQHYQGAHQQMEFNCAHKFSPEVDNKKAQIRSYMDAHLKNKELDTQLQDNLENHGKSLANQHSQVSVKPVSNAESFVTNEKYVPKKTPAEFMPETKTEAGLVITEKMAAQYEKKRDSYHQDPTQCRIKDHFYNRDFLHLMRDLVREMCPIDPPISEAQLVELGLNRVDKVPLPTSSNTVRSKKFKTRDNIFKTNWQQVSVKPASNAESSVTYEKYVPKKIQYEQKRDSYHQDPTQCRIEDHFYNRDFLLLMRDLVREMRSIDPPRSEAQLVGLVKPVSNAESSVTYEKYVPKRILCQKQTEAGPRLTEKMAAQYQQNRARLKGNIVCPSMMDQLETKQGPLSHLPLKSATAWKTKREMKFDSKSKSQDEQKYDKLVGEIRGLLNKITPTTYPDLSDEFIKYGLHKDEILLERVVPLIVEKAVGEPQFCSLYSDLCKKQCDHEIGSQHWKSNSQQAKTFRAGIINKCQSTFAPQTSSEKIAELEKKITEDIDEKLKTSIRDEIELVRSKENRRLLGIIKFLAHLYRRKLLNDRIITWSIIELVKNKKLKDDIYVECAVQMIETVGEFYEKKNASDKIKTDPKQTSPLTRGKKEEENQFEDIFLHITGLKNTVSNRVRFMILDMEELRANNWKPRGGDKCPKTVDAVQKSYEQRKQEMRRGEGGKRLPFPYVRRSSGQSHYGSNEAGVGTGTGQIYSHPINNTLIDPTQIRQQSQHPNPNMQSYGAGPQTHMAMRNGQTPTIQLPPNATLTSSNLGIAIRPDQQYVYATMITQPSMIPQKFYGQPVNVSGAVGPNQYFYPPQTQQFPQQSYGNIQMAQQYQAQQQSMGEQQPKQQSDTQTRPAPQIPVAALRPKKTRYTE